MELAALAGRRAIAVPREVVVTGVGGEGELRGSGRQGGVAMGGLRERVLVEEEEGEAWEGAWEE
eukprot:3054162-Rhodomonas_salina.1